MRRFRLLLAGCGVAVVVVGCDGNPDGPTVAPEPPWFRPPAAEPAPATKPGARSKRHAPGLKAQSGPPTEVVR